MLLEKQPLSMEELEAQSAIELPTRDQMLLTIIVVDAVDITLQDVNVAVAACAQLLTVTGGNVTFDCDARAG